MRLEETATKLDETMLGVLKDYARERGDNEGLVQFLDTVHRGEGILTALHLMEVKFGKGNPSRRELYDSNPTYYLDDMGNLYRGADERGRYVGSLEMADVEALR